MTTLIESMAGFVAGLTLDGIPSRVLRKARWQLLSTLGAIHASARHELGQAVLDAVRATSGDGPCTLIPEGRKVDALSAVWGASALSLALDYDDYLLFGHSGHSAVCVPLVLGEMLGRSLSDVLVAQVAANEVAGRMGASVVLGPHNGQAWSFIHLAASAAATAKMLGLPEALTAHAMAIALYQPNYVLWPGFMGPDSKVTTAATPAVTGVRSAFLAAAGARGALDIIEAPHGFLASFSYAPLAAFFTGLGRAWTTDTLAFKPWPGCAYVGSTVDAVAELRATRVQAEPPEEVVVAATLMTVQMDAMARDAGHFDPLSPIAINFSIPTNVALTWQSGRLDCQALSRSSLLRSARDIEAIAKRVRLVHDASMTADMLSSIDEVLDLRAVLATSSWTKALRAGARMWGEQRGKRRGESGLLSHSSWRQALAHLWGTRRARRARARPFDLGECDLASLSIPFSAQVTMRWSDGTTARVLQRVPLGAPGRPEQETKSLVIDKCVRECTPALGEAGANRLADLVCDDRALARDVVGAAAVS